VSVNIDLLKTAYFPFDKAVPYKAGDKIIEIKPVKLIDSALYSASEPILKMDKNSINDVKIIQMSYLQFISDVLIPSDAIYATSLGTILLLCLGMTNPILQRDDKGKPYLQDGDIVIKPNHFEEIMRIILYQNDARYDDEYINPDLKKAMQDMDKLKAKGKEPPNLERRMAIVTAHTGVPKKDLLEMTLRSFDALFSEVVGEVEFLTTRALILHSGQAEKADHWIFPKKKDKFEGYITDVGDYSKSMGGDGKVKTSSNTSMGDNYTNMLNKFE
jgi:hypothetical protein